MTKRIVLCADDYGQAETVSRGILELVAAKRLTAVSCLVNHGNIRDHAQPLLAYGDIADIGLHLNFTDGEPMSRVFRENVSKQFLPLSQVLWRTHARWPRFPHAAVSAEIHAQLDAFTVAFGGLPRFIDGHQHIHHLPGIREALFEVYASRLANSGVILRAVTQSPKARGIKANIIQFTGGGSFAQYLDQRGIPHNTTFAGIYPFRQSNRFRHYFQRFLQDSADKGLIMCHPGLASAAESKDPIKAARQLEFDYLLGPEFLADCRQADVKLARF